MAVTKTQSAVVTAATRQIMNLVKEEIDANKDKKIDEPEVNALMTAMDAFVTGSGAPSAGALPDEKTRMQMAVMQTLTRMGDDPKYKNADAIKLTDLRLNVKKTVNELVTTAKKADDGGLMNGLGGLMSMTMLPDVAVEHIKESLAKKTRGE